MTADELCLVDEVVEETVLKAVQSKDTAAAAAAAVQSSLMSRDAVEPSMHTLSCQISGCTLKFSYYYYYYYYYYY